MRIAYFSPLPPLRSGIADYSGELLPYLARHVEIDLFTDGTYRPSLELSARFPVHDYGRFARLHQQRGYDVCLYQMGNDVRFHEYVYRALLERPGVVVLHEYVLYHLIAGLTLVRGDRAGFVEEMRYCYGRTGAQLAQQMLDTGQPVDPWTWPLFERIADASLGLIVHSQHARERVLKSRPLARVGPVNQHLCLERLPAGAGNTASERTALGLPPAAFVVGSFGIISSPKRLDLSLRAFARLRREFPAAVYVLIGEQLPSADIERAIQIAGLEDAVMLTGYVDFETFLRYMATVDLALNLRFPTGGETSASAIRLMGLGKPVIVSNSGSFAEFPDDCCVKIDVDETEEEMLLAMMRALAVHEGLRRQIGANARRYTQIHHTLAGSAQGYVDFMQDVLTSPPQPVTAPAQSDVLSDLISDVAAAMVDWGIEETDEGVLWGVATAIGELLVDSET